MSAHWSNIQFVMDLKRERKWYNVKVTDSIWFTYLGLIRAHVEIGRINTGFPVTRYPVHIKKIRWELVGPDPDDQVTGYPVHFFKVISGENWPDRNRLTDILCILILRNPAVPGRTGTLFFSYRIFGPVRVTASWYILLSLPLTNFFLFLSHFREYIHFQGYILPMQYTKVSGGGLW